MPNEKTQIPYDSLDELNYQIVQIDTIIEVLFDHISEKYTELMPIFDCIEEKFAVVRKILAEHI